MPQLKKAFDTDTLVIWSGHDYSDPDTKCIGHFTEDDQVEILEQRFPGVLVRWDDKTIGWNGLGWVCEWNIECGK
jgi:hypothetical protein